MDELLSTVYSLMVDVFNDITKIEERELRNGFFSDVSVTEMHTVERIGLHSRVTMSELAKSLNITMGTLTVAVSNLVKKGYAERFKSDEDRRVVKVGLTTKGRVLYRSHRRFHTVLAKRSIDCLSQEEARVLSTALTNLRRFFSENYSI